MNTDSHHYYEPSQGHRLPHDPLNAIVAPRPIGWIATVDSQGRANLAPYSFFNAFSETPPIVGFSSGGRKDSQRNVEATGEFVVNLATRNHAIAMNVTSPPRSSREIVDPRSATPNRRSITRAP